MGVVECALLFSIGSYASAELIQPNCTRQNTKDRRTLACYACMGRDLDNCMTGLTCCKGSCFKLIDADHSVIVKGCVDSSEEDASMKVRQLDVKMYWANNENVKGQSYFCKGKAFCNAVPSASFTAVIASLFLVFLIR